MKITVFYSTPFSAKTGPTGVMKRFQDYHDIFEDGGKNEFMVFTPVDNGKNGASFYNGKQTIKKMLRNKIARVAKKTYLGGVYHIWQAFKPSKKTVEDYLATEFSEDVIIFNSVIDCYEYLKKRSEKNKAKIMMAIRSDGRSWEMDYMYYPKLRNSAGSRYLDKVEKVACDAVDAIVFVSEHSKAMFLSIHPQYAYKTYVIENGATPRDMDNTKRKFDYLHLVSVGSISVRKNQIAILRCINAIGDRSIKLTLVGAGDKIEECRKYTKDHGLESQVELLGDRDDVPEILDRCNTFIMTSFSEGLPNAGVEALRSGLPMIMTDAGGNAELVENNGLVVSTDDEAIEKAIRFFNSNISILPEYGKASRRLFESKFTAEVMMQKFYDLAKLVYGR